MLVRLNDIKYAGTSGTEETYEGRLMNLYIQNTCCEGQVHWDESRSCRPLGRSVVHNNNKQQTKQHKLLHNIFCFHILSFFYSATKLHIIFIILRHFFKK